MSLALAAILTGVIRRFAWRHGLLDVPNARSSHQQATPRGGGLAIVIAVTLGLLLLRWSGAIGDALLLALIGGGTAVAAVGYWDDRHRLPAGIRLLVHMLAALWALVCLGGLSPLLIGHRAIDLGWAGNVLALLGIVWTLNLFNFMDGIDGIAASEAVFIAWGGVVAALLAGHSSDIAATGLLIGGACLGFLPWNWSPARIFMGDVGSGYLGFVIAVTALAQARENDAGVWIWLILGSLFFADATVTLARRALRGERLHEAHRSHAYQWLARRWRSHRRVTATVLGINVLWLLPDAILAVRRPAWAASLVVVALIPLLIGAIATGSGRRENPGP